jgi:hypothetical protein
MRRLLRKPLLHGKYTNYTAKNAPVWIYVPFFGEKFLPAHVNVAIFAAAFAAFCK